MRAPRGRAVDALCFLLLLVALARAASASTVVVIPQPAAAQGRGLTTTVSGVVVDERGNPVADAEVEVVPAAQRSIPQRARADAAGRFALFGLKECESYVFRASHRGFAAERLSATSCGTPSGLRLILHPGLTAFGTVVDDAGRPVGGARVEITEGDPPHTYRSVSRADGSFQISDLPEGRLWLGVTHRDFPPLTGIEVRASRETGRLDLGRLSFLAGKRFLGKVLDSQGHPLAGARVLFDPDREPVAVTGPDGGFEIARLTQAAILYICLPGYESSRNLVVYRSPSPEPRRFVLTPKPPRPRVSGRVIDEAGRPVSGAQVSPGDPERLWIARQQRSWDLCIQQEGPLAQTTDASGRFTFDLPESGMTELWARAPGYLREIQKISGGQTSGIDVVLHRGTMVAGQVFAADGTTPAAGARVYATQEGGTAETVTDARGRYRLAAVQPGWRELWADHPDLGEARRRLELTPGTRRLDLTLDGRREPAIAGRVTGPDGEPLAGVEIQYESFSSSETGEDGGFRLVQPRGHPLLLSKTGSLILSREGYATLVYPFQPSSLPLEGLEIRLERSPVLTGRVLGVKPEELTNVWIEATGKGIDPRPGRIEPDGTYRFSDLGTGTWTVQASLGHRKTRRTVELGPEGASLDLELPALTRVQGRVLAPDGGAVSEVTVWFAEPGREADPWMSTLAQPDGTFSIEVPAGRYRVSAAAKTYGPTPLEEPLVVEDRPIDGLEIHLKPGIVLQGRILGIPEEARASLGFTRANQDLWADVATDGTYRCAGLGPGEWKVLATLDLGEVHRVRETRVTLAPGAPEAVLDIDLSLEDLTLAGRLTSGEEPLSASVSLLLNGQTIGGSLVEGSDGGGAFLFQGLSAGRYLLQIEDYYRERRIEVPVDLTSDRTLTVDLLGARD